MNKPFNIHDWQDKQKHLFEHTVTFTKDDMSKLHNDGKLVKADDDGKEHTYIYNELDEANVTGTGTTISTGESPAFATPFAFGKKKDKDIEVFGYKKVNEQEEPQEIELSRDVKVLEKLLSDRINTKDEWVEMFELLINHTEEISTLNTSFVKNILQQSIKEL